MINRCPELTPIYTTVLHVYLLGCSTGVPTRWPSALPGSGWPGGTTRFRGGYPARGGLHRGATIHWPRGACPCRHQDQPQRGWVSLMRIKSFGVISVHNET